MTTVEPRRTLASRGWLRRCAGVALLLAAVTASGETLAQPLQPLVVGWEQFFKLSWEPAERRGRPVVWGRIQNDWGMPAAQIRLLVDELDSAGRLVGQDIGWLGTSLPPGITAEFEVPVRERAASYRVSVFAFTWVQVGHGGDNR